MYVFFLVVNYFHYCFCYRNKLIFILLTFFRKKNYRSAMPEVRGTADMDGGAYQLFLPLSRTPSRLSSFRSTDRRRGTDGTCDRTRTLFAHHFSAICDGGGSVCRELRTTTSFGPQSELPFARMVIHRQTSARAPRKETLSVQSRSGIWRFSSPNSISYG